jgi:pyrroline-5-carboxylate reductase
MKIGMIGCGKMAQALARGFVASGAARADELLGYDVDPATARHWQADLAGGMAASNTDLVRQCEVVFLAVKPQAMAGVLQEIRGVITPAHLVVSIAAGVTLGQLTEPLVQGARVIRVMPNTPCLVGAGASGLAAGGSATSADVDLVKKLLASVGTAHQVSEPMLDGVTGLSGSGPAYVYLVIEALSDGGVKAGLPREMATQLAAQTVLGAAKMVLETGLHPGVLKDMVTSPAGTTIAGLQVLEARGVRSAMLDAVDAATLRAKELGRR